MIIDDTFRKEFGKWLEGHRRLNPKDVDDDGTPWCDLHHAGFADGESCGRAVVAFGFDPQHFVFLCAEHVLGLADYAKELTADAEWIKKNIPRDEYGNLVPFEMKP